MKYALVTGSAGLVGGEAVAHLCSEGFSVVGIDNDFRSLFFGSTASTSWNTRRLRDIYSTFEFNDIDIRDYEKMKEVFKKQSFELIIHTAAQPSHDWAAKDPLLDFSINANGTLNLLELTRLYSPEATFIFTSTNKVYGNTPNFLNLIEQDLRFDLPNSHRFWQGIDESMSIDNSTHSLFGVSKCSADLLVQEYGRYFNLRTGVFRGGCLTGPMHSSTELHGFLSYLVKSIVLRKNYKIFGYKGKQVRDNLHANDLISMFMEFHKNPKSGEVYNVGGGRENSISIIEAIKLIELNSGSSAITEYQEVNRTGDHKWYITNLSKFKSHYPNWKLNHPLEQIITEMVKSVRV